MSSRRTVPGGEATMPPVEEAVIWHDVECSGYAADLPLWRELAAAAHGPVLELGAGTGRVALDLAERGHEVAALDCDPPLVRELGRRARAAGLRVHAHVGDARAFELGRRFSLVIAPMQVAQLLGGDRGRRSMLAAVRRHSHPGTRVAIALADPLEGLPPQAALPPLPDVREVGGWTYSSRPVAVAGAEDGLRIDRVREAVSPTGDLRESAATICLDPVKGDALAAMARAMGFRDLAPRRIGATEAYVGSEVVVLEAV